MDSVAVSDLFTVGINKKVPQFCSYKHVNWLWYDTFYINVQAQIEHISGLQKSYPIAFYPGDLAVITTFKSAYLFDNIAEVNFVKDWNIYNNLKKNPDTK